LCFSLEEEEKQGRKERSKQGRSVCFFRVASKQAGGGSGELEEEEEEGRSHDTSGMSDLCATRRAIGIADVDANARSQGQWRRCSGESSGSYPWLQCCQGSSCSVECSHSSDDRHCQVCFRLL